MSVSPTDLPGTSNTDRSVAIRGLEQRLVNGFNTRGGYGIFESHLGRSLLWRRCQDSYVTKMSYPPDRQVPTWSWMRHLGRITYLDVPFAKIEWSEDLESPFPTEPRGLSDQHCMEYEPDKIYWTTDEPRQPLPLKARARKFNFQEARQCIIFDTNDRYNSSLLRCVIVGKDRDDGSGGNQRCYVLIIQQVFERKLRWWFRRKLTGYIRAGVGSIEQGCIDMDQEPICIKIV